MGQLGVAPQVSRDLQDHTRHHLSGRVLWTSALYAPGLPARAPEVGPRRSFWKGARPVREEVRVRVQAPK